MVEMMEVQMETVVQPGDEKMEGQSRWLIKKSGEWRVFFFFSDYLLNFILAKEEHYHNPSFRPKDENSSMVGARGKRLFK